MSSLFQFFLIILSFFPPLPPSQPLDVAVLLLLPFLPPLPPLPPHPPPSPTVWRWGRQRWDCCPHCWRIRPGGFMPRRPSCSSVSPWVSGACDTDLPLPSHKPPLNVKLLLLFYFFFFVILQNPPTPTHYYFFSTLCMAQPPTPKLTLNECFWVNLKPACPCFNKVPDLWRFWQYPSKEQKRNVLETETIFLGLIHKPVVLTSVSMEPFVYILV